MIHIRQNIWFLILGLYTIITIIFQLNWTNLYTNIINPLFWSTISIYLIFYKKNIFIMKYDNRKYLIYILILNLIFTILYYYIGLIFGFTKTPYSHELINIFKNILIGILPIIGQEELRTFLIIKNRNNKKAFLFITIIFILIELNYHAISKIIFQREELFKYTCSTIFFLIASNTLYTYLIINSSHPIPLMSRIIDALILFLTPIIPNMDWFINGSMNLLKLMIFYIIFKYKMINEKKIITSSRKNYFTKVSYLLAIISSITDICFMIGIFKYEPIAILSNSMLPTFARGDVVIFQKIDEQNLNYLPIDTIIIYKLNKQNIMHRIIKRGIKNEKVYYITKGDNNNTADSDAVFGNQIMGIYVLNVKFIGYPTIWLNEFFNYQEASVETK